MRGLGAPPPRLAGHRIEAVVHAVDEVDVSMPAEQVEALVALRPPARPGVAGAVGSPEVGLGLDQPERQALTVHLMHEITPEEIAGYGFSRPAIKGGGQ